MHPVILAGYSSSSAMRYTWLLVLLGVAVEAQPGAVQTWRVFFRDKGPEPFRPGSRLYEQTLALHSPRALARRAKVRPPEALLTFADAPVYQPYLDSLRRWGELRLVVRWRNYAVLQMDSLAAEAVRQLPFVAAVQPTGQVPLPVALPQASGGIAQGLGWQEHPCGPFDYGASRWQLEMLKIPAVHRIGVTGEGVLLGLLDTGFRWRQQPGFAHLQVLAEWDFLGNDSVTANQPGDDPLQDLHGTAVLSVLGAVLPGTLIGAAPMATYILGKTEELPAERHIEEDAYAAALEWMEALGVDVVSSSLGYRDFDSTEVSYTAAQLDGRTTIVAQAVEEAARRGVLCVTAMGNDGACGLNSPADADSVIAVAAVDSAGQRVHFSSVGRRQHGILRPSLAAPGIGVLGLLPGQDQPRPLAGTSMATPLVAGAVALLLAARPELPPWRIRQALLETASNAEHPDTLLGYGVPNLVRALLRLGGAVGPPALVESAQSLRAVAFAFVPFPLFGAWLQWGDLPREEAIRGTIPLRSLGTDPLTLFGELPRELLRTDTVWARVRLVGSAGEELLGRWYLLRLPPSVPCGMVIPPEVLALPAAEQEVLRISPQPVPLGEVCTVSLPGLSPGGRLPLRAVQLWDAVGRHVRRYTLAESTQPWSGTRWTLRLPTAGLAAGVYWLEALYGSNGAERLFAPIVLR